MGVVLYAHAAATLFMTGLIWFVQMVHYPLMAKVGAEGYPAYQAAHQQLTTLVVGPPMLVEAATTAMIVFRFPGSKVGWLGAGLLAAIWISTALLQVPAHEALSAGFDSRVHERLVTTNWIRTIGWTVRAGLALWLLGTTERAGY